MNGQRLQRVPKVSIASIALLVSVACTGAPTPESLAGTYVRDSGNDTILLDSAGHYRRRFAGTDGLSGNDSGAWHLANNSTQIVLRDLRTFLPQHGSFDPARGWHAPDTARRQFVTLAIERSWTGTPTLALNRDLLWSYTRR